MILGRWGICVSLCLALASTSSFAATKPVDKGVESAGTIVAIALPIAADGISIFQHNDWDGVAELTESTLATIGVAYILKNVVHERRPDGSDNQSFPSDTEALALAPANYLWSRYGWTYGLPAYAAAAFVGYSRVAARKHHWYDVAASEALSLGVNYAFVTPFRDSRYSLYASADPDGIGIHFAMRL